MSGVHRLQYLRHVAFRIAVDTAQHGGPGTGEGQQAAAHRDLLAAVGLDFGRDAGERARRRPWLTGGDPRQGRDHDRACFGLPPGVHDRTSLTSDVLVVPHPRLRIDRLTDRAKQPEGGEVATLGPLIAPPHEGADRRWCGVEDGGAVAFDDLPEPILLWPIRSAFVHQHRRAVGQRSVHHVAVPRDPADIRRAPIDVVFLEVEYPLGRGVGADQIPTGRVHDALWLACRTGRIEDVEHVLRVHPLRLTDVGGSLHQLVVPVVASFLDVHGDR